MDQVAREVDFDTILQSAADGRYYIYISEELVCENFMPGYQMCETPATEGRTCPQLTIRRLAAQCILRVVLLLVSKSVQSTHNLGGSSENQTHGFFLWFEIVFYVSVVVRFDIRSSLRHPGHTHSFCSWACKRLSPFDFLSTFG